MAVTDNESPLTPPPWTLTNDDVDAVYGGKVDPEWLNAFLEGAKHTHDLNEYRQIRAIEVRNEKAEANKVQVDSLTKVIADRDEETAVLKQKAFDLKDKILKLRNLNKVNGLGGSEDSARCMALTVQGSSRMQHIHLSKLNIYKNKSTRT